MNPIPTWQSTLGNSPHIVAAGAVGGTRMTYKAPAFPTTSFNHAGQTILGADGMTLRDYFAAKALSHPYAFHDTDPAKAAEWAYAIADAMLEARK